MTPQDVLNLRGTGQKVTLNIIGTVPALTSVCFASHPIARPFLLYLVRPHFALNQNRQVELRIYASYDDDTVNITPVSGTNILQATSVNPYLVGDDEYKEIFQDYAVPEANTFLKILASNLDSYDHTVDCQLFLELF
jgi:hypothetical protein